MHWILNSVTLMGKEIQVSWQTAKLQKLKEYDAGYQNGSLNNRSPKNGPSLI